MAERDPTKHLVLVHGAWQGRWSFAAWTPMLEAAGWHVHATDLPGNGWGPQALAPASLAHYTTHVAGLLASLGHPAVVVGHSGGGITASQVAEALPERVTALVYLAGMMLPSGVSYADLALRVAAADPAADVTGISAFLDHDVAADTTTVRPEGAHACFVQDCDPAAARDAVALLRPQPESGRRMVNQLSTERFGRVPRLYVECTEDRSVTLPMQREMQRLSPGAKRLPIACGHVPQLAQPERLTRLLVPELDALHARRLLSPSTP
ncbi:MAG: alpha/beta hydrolase [Rhizobacter sp.]